MTPDVVKVKALQGSNLEVEFADGSIRLFDVKTLLRHPAFSGLSDAAFFAKAKVFNGTVSWSDEVDISPDTLYLHGKIINHGQVAQVIPAA